MTPEIRAHHDRLSPAGGRFLDFARANPEALRRSTFAPLVEDDSPIFAYAMQPWPTLVDAARAAELGEVAVGLARLLREAPKRLLGSDPKRLAEYFDLPPDQAELIAAFLGLEDAAATACLGNWIGRGDFLYTHRGLQCVEFNMESNLGGWEAVEWGKRYREVPVLERFFRQEGVEPRVRRTLRIFFRSQIDTALATVAAGASRLNAAILVEGRTLGAPVKDEYFRRQYRAALREIDPALEGELTFCRYEDLSLRGSEVQLGGEPLRIALQLYRSEEARSVMVAFLDGKLHLYNSLPGIVWGDKLCLALLSEFRGAACFSPAERRLIRRHVPWTRRVADTSCEYRVEQWSLPELLAERREEMVIKAGRSLAGAEVFVGTDFDAATWRQKVRAALAEPGWVAQERVESLPFLYQCGEEGAEPHDVVWGLFACGERYGGGTTRMQPRGRGGVVNAARGATTGPIFELQPAEAGEVR